MEALATDFQDFEDLLATLTSRFKALSRAFKAHSDVFVNSHHNVHAIPALAAGVDAQEEHVASEPGWC